MRSNIDFNHTAHTSAIEDEIFTDITNTFCEDNDLQDLFDDDFAWDEMDSEDVFSDMGSHLFDFEDDEFKNIAEELARNEFSFDF